MSLENTPGINWHSPPVMKFIANSEHGCFFYTLIKDPAKFPHKRYTVIGVHSKVSKICQHWSCVMFNFTTVYSLNVKRGKSTNEKLRLLYLIVDVDTCCRGSWLGARSICLRSESYTGKTNDEFEAPFSIRSQFQTEKKCSLKCWFWLWKLPSSKVLQWPWSNIKTWSV